MKFTLSWLKDHIDTSASLDEIVETLTRIGVEVAGMLCSGSELEISDDHDGIIDLPADAPVGVPYATYAGLDDPVIEINLTPNRPDCTSIHGIARDLAAAGLGTLKNQAPPEVRGVGTSPVSVTLA